MPLPAVEHRRNAEVDSPLLALVLYFIKPADYLNEALATVVAQLSPAVELIVVAGHEPDEELGIAPEFLPRIDRLIVEPDEGAWEAANKGWRAARAVWVQFVMADDRLPEGSIAATLSALRSLEADLASGGMTFFETVDGKDTVIRSVPGRALTLDRVLGDVCSPALIYRRAFLQRLGGMDGRYRYSHDREFLLRAWQLHARHAVLPHQTYWMRIHGSSRTTSGNRDIILAFLAEHVVWADHLLRDYALPSAAQSRIRRWRDEEWVKFKITHALAGRPSDQALSPPIPAFRAACAAARIGMRRARRLLAGSRQGSLEDTRKARMRGWFFAY